MCIRFQFCTHQRVCVLNFLKKVKFVVPYCTVYTVHTSWLFLDGGEVGGRICLGPDGDLHQLHHWAALLPQAHRSRLLRHVNLINNKIGFFYKDMNKKIKHKRWCSAEKIVNLFCDKLIAKIRWKDFRIWKKCFLWMHNCGICIGGHR